MNTFKKTFAWFCFICLCELPFSFLAFGSDLSTRQSSLYPYRSTIAVQDDFLFGTCVTGNVGDLGWTASGTVTAIASSTGRPGQCQLSTTAVISTVARLNSFTFSLYEPSFPHKVVWAFKLNNNDANTTTRHGSANSWASNPPNDGIYLEKLDADTNWFCVTRSGGVQTRTDSGVAVTTNFVTTSYTRNSSGVMFYIDYVSVCGTMTTNITSTVLTPGIYIINSAAAAKTIDVDYVQFEMSGLSR